MSFEKKIYRSIDRRGGEEKFGFENEIKYRFQNVQNGQKNKVFPQKRFPFFAQEFEPNSSKRWNQNVTLFSCWLYFVWLYAWSLLCMRVYLSLWSQQPFDLTHSFSAIFYEKQFKRLLTVEEIDKFYAAKILEHWGEPWSCG